MINNPPFAKSSDRKIFQKLQEIKEFFDQFSYFDTYIFRFFALLFLLGVECTLIVAMFQNREVGAGLLTAITVIAVLPILVIRVFDISVLNLTKEGVEAQMLRSEMNEVLSKVDRLFVLAMSDQLYKILLSLNGVAPVPYKLDDNQKRQLYYLQDIGYVGFTAIPLQDAGEDLRKHVIVTKTGREFLELRSSIKE